MILSLIKSSWDWLRFGAWKLKFSILVDLINVNNFSHTLSSLTLFELLMLCSLPPRGSFSWSLNDVYIVNKVKQAVLPNASWSQPARSREAWLVIVTYASPLGRASCHLASAKWSPTHPQSMFWIIILWAVDCMSIHIILTYFFALHDCFHLLLP